ncbi:MAG: hypothetical protein KDB40_20365 [Acidimicrobiales bacterium]|nr:hypothetical protein [Acidimicrobiales bacterium]MCB9394235.1 hypothetical protein [Acidimicrobiaceae bacterium]
MSSDPLAREREGSNVPSPFAVCEPDGAQGWRDLYAPSLLFGPARRSYEESAFWFREAVHWTRPVRPFEAAVLQIVMASLGQFNHRHYTVPAARGIDVRVLHGYCYLSPGSIDDLDVIDARVDTFGERAGFYYRHWDELYTDWMTRIRDLIARLDDVHFPTLPDVMPTDEVLTGHGAGRSWQVSSTYHRLVDLLVELWQAHFEFLNLGYAAYLDFFAFCRSVTPELDDLELARMVAGIDVDLFRPDQELRRLARAAVDLGLAPLVIDTPVGDLLDVLSTVPNGATWVERFAATADPWFNYSTGSGFYHDDAVWADRPDYPLTFVRGYVEQLLAGSAIDTPTEQILAERDRIADRVRAALGETDRERFDDKLALARTVFHFVENHNFYVEHWGMSLVWRRLREFGALFVAAGFWPRPDDLFLLRPDEIEQAMWDLLGSWASGTPAYGPTHWPTEVRRRETILAACARSTPPAALGVPPTIVSEPLTIMLWGLTSESLQQWTTGGDDDLVAHGLSASPGIVVGRARVVHSIDDLDAVEDGEILVTELTSPSWAPVFASIAGTVTESGGMMSHTAIVCREYGLPAVTGVVRATQRFRTGQILRLDGSTGTVTVVG